MKQEETTEMLCFQDRRYMCKGKYCMAWEWTYRRKYIGTNLGMEEYMELPEEEWQGDCCLLRRHV